MSASPHRAPSTVPSGTVTFVFTDIEGSTQRWDRDRHAMQDAVRKHDGLVRDAIAAHGGHVFKTIGDAFCAAFSKPEDAVAAVFGAQQALAAEDFSPVGGIRVRAAIHTGTADEREDDYFGPTVNRVARLLSVTYGGQVLLSGVTADLVHGTLPAGASLRGLGEHRLKDLSRPEHVYQLVGPALIAEFPPLRSLGSHPNNLPIQTTSFVGREAEVAAIESLVRQHRLVTLVGSGGIGKTRTSIHAAANLIEEYPDGIWLVELAPLSSGEYLASTIAQTLGTSLPDGDPTANLVEILKPKRALLVLDNCEHLIDSVARVVGAILRGCPHIRAIASSRQALGIGGESVFRMPSLPNQTGVALFAERARASDNRFALTPENEPVVADLCRRLDGIALAIELAAVRVKILTPQEIRDHLDERFRVLTGGSRDALPRQQTLRALIDWSHDLLDERERSLLRRVAIFVDGFSLQGAVAVGGGEGLDEFDVLDVLGSLVDKSLVGAETSGEVARYRLLESTRAYALEKLCEAGELELATLRHLGYLRDLFEELKLENDRTGRLTEINAVLKVELDDVRVALDASLTGSNPETGAHLLVALGRAWEPYGLHLEAVRRIEEHVDRLPQSECLLLAELYALWSSFEFSSGKSARSADIAQRGLVQARASGNAVALFNVLRISIRARIKLGELAAAESALTEAQSIPGLPQSARLSLSEARAHVSLATGDLAAAALALNENLAYHRELGNIRGANVVLMSVAEVEFLQGHREKAIETLRGILSVLETAADDQVFLTVLENLAYYLVAVDQPAEAEQHAREVIRTLAPRESRHGLVFGSIEVIASVEAIERDARRAAVLSAYVDAGFASMGYERIGSPKLAYDRLTALLREKLPEDERVRLSAEGAALSPEAAILLVSQQRTACD
jgi:predicted ATPase/class 3 adenylate cyclase